MDGFDAADDPSIDRRHRAAARLHACDAWWMAPNLATPRVATNVQATRPAGRAEPPRSARHLPAALRSSPPPSQSPWPLRRARRRHHVHVRAPGGRGGGGTRTRTAPAGTCVCMPSLGQRAMCVHCMLCPCMRRCSPWHWQQACMRRRCPHPTTPPLRAPTHHGLIIRVAGPARAPLLTSHERPRTDRCARYVRAVHALGASCACTYVYRFLT